MFFSSLLLALQLQIPSPVGYVNDFAGVLDDDSKSRMQAIIDQVKQKSGGEIVVVTLKDLGGRASIDVARDIGRQWRVGATGGPGDRAKNAGVILLFQPGNRPGDGRADIAIATGSGAEGFVTDAFAGRVRDAIGRRAVETGSYAEGLVTGVALLGQAYATEFGFQLSDEAAGASPGLEISPDLRVKAAALVGILGFLMFLFIVSRFRRRSIWNTLFWIAMSRRGTSGRWGGGGWGGGGGGFGGFGGGGGFSGGGASGRF